MTDMDSKTRSAIRSALRKIWWQRSAARKNVLKAAQIRRGWSVCMLCGCETKNKEMKCDHYPLDVGPTPGSKNAKPGHTWDEFFRRMFCGEENLRAICKSCHDCYTASQRKKK